MQWLYLIHPTLHPMSSPMELDASPHTNADTIQNDPGGSGAVLGQRTDITWQLGSFINSLPREIISEIFSSVRGVENAASSSSMSTTLTPLRLTHVSRLWREVAISTPRLWTHLNVVSRRADITSALELVKLWVPRCKSRPLTINVCFKDKYGPFIIYPEDSLNLFRVITKTAALLRKAIDSETDKACFETHIKAGSSGTLPILEERYLWYHGVETTPDARGAFIVPLTVCGVRRAVDEFGFRLHRPLGPSLTTLELQDSNGITSLSITDLLIVFSEFPHLQKVSAYIDHGDNPPQELVVAANLKSLSLSWPSATDCGALLDLLIAPRVERLVLSGDVPAGGQWDHLWRFIRQSNPPLRNVALEHFDATAARLAECLAMCLRLESLWLEDCDLDDEFIASLGRRSTFGESVFSRLRIFGLVSAEDVTGDCLVQSLKSTNTDRMREVFVFDCSGVLQEHCDAVEQHFGGSADAETIIVTPGDPFD